MQSCSDTNLNALKSRRTTVPSLSTALPCAWRSRHWLAGCTVPERNGFTQIDRLWFIRQENRHRRLAGTRIKGSLARKGRDSPLLAMHPISTPAALVGAGCFLRGCRRPLPRGNHKRAIRNFMDRRVHSVSGRSGLQFASLPAPPEDDEAREVSANRQRL